jgi:transcription elongation factor GreA
MANVIYLTKEGLKKLQEELEHLTTIERPSISKQIAEARDKGDLSENAEYDAAKEAQGMLEMKIAKLQETIRNSRLLEQSQIDIDSVQIMCKVKLLNTKLKKEVTYILVSETEANIKEGKISVQTPIAQGLLGKKVGQIAKVKVPNGDLEFKILEISHS